MAKLIKKDKCKFKQGHIVKKGKVIGLPFAVWLQLNKFELMIQEYWHLRKQPAYQPAPSMDGFERKSMFGNDRPYVEMPDTPTTDKRVGEALAFMAEADAVSDAKMVNQVIDDFGALIDWCNSEEFIEGDCLNVIDTPEIGNPLELDADEIAFVIEKMVTVPAIKGGKFVRIEED